MKDASSRLRDGSHGFMSKYVKGIHRGAGYAWGSPRYLGEADLK